MVASVTPKSSIICLRTFHSFITCWIGSTRPFSLSSRLTRLSHPACCLRCASVLRSPAHAALYCSVLILPASIAAFSASGLLLVYAVLRPLRCTCQLHLARVSEAVQVRVAPVSPPVSPRFLPVWLLVLSPRRSLLPCVCSPQFLCFFSHLDKPIVIRLR